MFKSNASASCSSDTIDCSLAIIVKTMKKTDNELANSILIRKIYDDVPTFNDAAVSGLSE